MIPLAALVLLAIAPSRAADDLDALAKKLKDPEERERREAVQSLAKLGTAPAWSLVVDALKDAEPMVADEAQLALGGLSDPAVLKDLLGKRGLASGDAWVRLRAAEALGRMSLPIDSGALGRALSDKDAELRRTMAWTIERLARSNRLDAKAPKYLQSALDAARKKDKDPEVRAACALAEQVVGVPPQTNLVLESGRDESSAVRCAALRIAALKGAEDLFEIWFSWEGAQDLALRRTLVDVLAPRGDRIAAGTLVRMLEEEGSLRLRWTIVDALERMSGRPMGLDPPSWKRWFAELPEGWKAPGAAPSTDPKRVYDTTTAVFMGMPVLSDRLAILVDFSGSLWEKRESGKTRKELLDVEIRRTLEALRPSDSFNLIPYTDVPMPWEKALVPATPANVKRAIQFFEGCKASGKGNFWDAAMLALADPKVDTIMLFSDGAPTGGHRWNLNLMRGLFAEKNRFRQVVLDAVIVDAKKFIQERWKDMCEDSGGRMLAIDPK